MTELEPDDNNGEQSSVAGCLLMLVCLAVIGGGVALYVVTWRDADSGRPLPRTVAILIPLLAGGLCYGIGTTILRILGLPVYVKPEKESSDGSQDPETTDAR